MSAGAAVTTLLAADTGGSYVAAAYLVFAALLMVYIGIMAVKLVRIQRSLGDLLKRSGERRPGDKGSQD